MDRRQASHIKGKKLERFLKTYLKERKEVEKLKKAVAAEEKDKQKRDCNYNMLWLANSAIRDASPDFATVLRCSGCPQCQDSDLECFTVIVNK